jgi:hypothetical protein
VSTVDNRRQKLNLEFHIALDSLFYVDTESKCVQVANRLSAGDADIGRWLITDSIKNVDATLSVLGIGELF